MRDEDTSDKLRCVICDDLFPLWKVYGFGNFYGSEVDRARALQSTYHHLNAWLRAQRQRARGEKTNAAKL